MIEFGTGGWRAIIADEFTRANVRLLTQGLADRMAQERTAARGVVIGHDRRFMSTEAMRWAVEVLLGNGIPVTMIDRAAPTPMIMWTVRNLGCAYGLAVTASHNPATYNGIKVFTEGGRDASAEVTGELQNHIQRLGADDVRAVAPHEVDGHPLLTVQTSMNWYIDAIIAQLDLEAIRHRHLTVVLDPMFGVSQTCLQTILMTARCDVEVIHSRHDALFGGRMPSPTQDALQDLRRTVIDRRADVGMATDGDADRLGIFDDQGNYLSANQIMVMLYEYLLTGKGWTGDVVRNIATTHLLDRVAAAHGQRCHEVPVGFKHISAAMAQTDALLGGESSGGLTVRGHIPGKDGIHAASLLVEMLARSEQPLSRLWADVVARYGDLHMVERAYGFVPQRRQELSRMLLEQHDLPTFPQPVARVSEADGLKVYLADEAGSESSWVVVRFSGTEPVLRLFAEAATEQEAVGLADTMADFLGLGETI